jgi:thioredoxin-dependent peroxiredoxin
MAIKVGDAAPTFQLSDQAGNMVSLETFRGKPFVLYFYPKDDTPGCTVESCAFRDQYDVFQAAGATVVGISGDSPEPHKNLPASTNFCLPCSAIQRIGFVKPLGQPQPLG